MYRSVLFKHRYHIIFNNTGLQNYIIDFFLNYVHTKLIKKKYYGCNYNIIYKGMPHTADIIENLLF